MPYNSNACLTLVGVGPGDPALLTLAAVKAIQESTVVAYPISKEGEGSLAAKIAAKWITEEKKQLPLIFPMVNEVHPRKEAWRKAGDRLVMAVEDGQRVVFLCQGDVSLFSSSSYLLLEIKLSHPKCPIKLVPGVNSFSAAAAIGHWPLALQQDQLLITPTPENPEILEKLLKESASLRRVVVLLKLGCRWTWVRPLLEKMNLLEASLFAQRVGLADEKVISSSEVPANSRPYFSLLLIRQGWPDVMP